MTGLELTEELPVILENLRVINYVVERALKKKENIPIGIIACADLEHAVSYDGPYTLTPG